jgi:predicted transcriptional regulator
MAERLHVEDVEDTILELLKENGRMTTAEIAEALSEKLNKKVKKEALFVILSRIKKKGKITSMLARFAPGKEDQWWKYKKDQAWMLVEDAEKLGLIKRS